jgi:rhodanese-related sulfurtransferase
MRRREAGLVLGGGILALCAQAQQKTPSRISADDLKKRIDEKKDLFFIDVRTPQEIQELGSLKGYVNIPVDQIESRLSEIPKNRYIVTA